MWSREWATDPVAAAHSAPPPHASAQKGTSARHAVHLRRRDHCPRAGLDWETTGNRARGSNVGDAVAAPRSPCQTPWGLAPGTAHAALRSPAGGAVVAVVGEEVVVELPEDVQGDSPVGRRHVVVGLPEHSVEAVQRQVPAQQLVGHAVDFQEAIQLLRGRGDRSEGGMGPGGGRHPSQVQRHSGGRRAPDTLRRGRRARPRTHAAGVRWGTAAFLSPNPLTPCLLPFALSAAFRMPLRAMVAPLGSSPFCTVVTVALPLLASNAHSAQATWTCPPNSRSAQCVPAAEHHPELASLTHQELLQGMVCGRGSRDGHKWLVKPVKLCSVPCTGHWATYQ